MANLKYKNGDNSWTSILLTRGATGPQGEPGQNGLDAEITLNGIKNRIAEFYAPINAGQAGQFLMSNGEGQAPTFASVPVGTETINNLTTSTFVENQALSAYQGYILNQNKVDKSTTIAGTNLQDSITATELKTSLSIPTSLTIGNTKKNLATGDMGWSVSEIGAAPASHSHDYIPLTGGTLTSGSIKKAGGSYSWNTIRESNESAPISITSYSGYQPAIKQKTPNGVYGIGCYTNNVHITYFTDASTDNSPIDLLTMNYNGNGISAGGVNIPHVWVQSGTPSAKQTGDIWIIP